ncbi:MAG: efflux RND transporter permease subunit, partial [Chromatocurvus sp.]
MEDITTALQQQNVELPAGSIQSETRDFSLRVVRSYRTEQQFRDLIVRRTPDGGLIRLGDVARVEIAEEDYRNFFHSNGEGNVGLGIVKQSTANLVQVARDVRQEMERVKDTLPPGVDMRLISDNSVFVDSSVKEVYRTFAFASVLVILMTYLFIGDWRATLIPALTLPISVVSTFIALSAFGYSLNMITLLALILAIGLVIDDAIVVLENVYSRVTKGVDPLIASFEGSRQVSFAVIATSVILVSVFTPITFLQGKVGKLFGEFAVTLSAAIVFSTLVALTLTPALSSVLLKPVDSNWLAKRVDRNLEFVKAIYLTILESLLNARVLVISFCLLVLVAIGWLVTHITSEYIPYEDRGYSFVVIQGPEGASFETTAGYVEEIEKRLMPLVTSGEVENILTGIPGFGGGNAFNTGTMFMPLSDWGSGRRDARAISQDINRRISDITGVTAFALVPKGLGLGSGAPVQFVIGGADYGTLRDWRDTLIMAAEKNPGLERIDHDHKENKPQMLVAIDVDRAGDLGVSTVAVSRTLETFFGSRKT